MNVKQLKELAQILRQNELSALEVTEGETHIRMERKCQEATAPAAASIVPVSAPLVSPIADEKDPGVDFNHVFEVKSPMVGVFYAQSSPDSKPFVEVGAKVKKGDILCIIEAMKLMNEIIAERDGEIVDCCVHNGDVVEYGQPLFRLF